MNLDLLVIDADLSEPEAGRFCLCPVVLDGNGNPMEVITGLSILCDSAPGDKTVHGVFHSGGKREAEKWLRRHLPAVASFCAYGNPELIGSGVGKAILKLFSDNHPDDLKPLHGILELREALRDQYGILLP